MWVALPTRGGHLQPVPLVREVHLHFGGTRRRERGDTKNEVWPPRHGIHFWGQVHGPCRLEWTVPEAPLAPSLKDLPLDSRSH
jgi:hypothetical protein